MALEALVIILDNSESMRNGDYFPTRFVSQNEAAEFMIKSKKNTENSVGIISMAGDGPKVHATLSDEPDRALASLHNIRINGSIQLVNSIQTAQMALKHRQNRNQQQKIVVFVGSLIEDSEEDLLLLAKLIRKNKIFVDVVSLGDYRENNAKLSRFVDEMNNKEHCHLIIIGSSARTSIREYLLDTPICGDEVYRRGFDDEDNINDPELALALQMSMEEECKRTSKQTS